MTLDRNDIIRIYNRLKRRAFRAYDCGSYNKCLKYINVSARVAYKFSWIFKDDDLEFLLKEVSKSVFKPAEYFQPDTDKYVFYDSFSYDNKGLTQQYIRALMKLDVSILYISESSRKNDYSQEIFSELIKYNKAEIVEIPKDYKQTKKADLIYKQIIKYNPAKMLMHLAPDSVSPLVAFYALPKEIIKYQINFTDHAFWLGAGCTDFSFEFRPYGCTLSQNQRSIGKERIFLMPYYPIINEVEFQSFPEECKDKVIVFSGGAYPKILGENNFFLNLVYRILLANANAIFLFAGSGDDESIKRFIAENELEKRFILLGHRTDINEVFKHCDIYMSTYPLGGGLMGQFAAINAKPILAYSTIDKINSWTEETVCQFKKIKITHTDINEFLDEAKKLISDEKYRLSYGTALQECVVSIDKFNKTFVDILKNNTNQVQYDFVDVNVDLICKHNIDIENNNEFKIDLFKTIKFAVLFISPSIFFWAFTYIFTKSFKLKASRRLKKNDHIINL